MIHSRDAHCRSFDRPAKEDPRHGPGRDPAIRRRNPRSRPRLRDIKGTAINDGYDKIGFTAPSVAGQSAAIKSALAAANVPTNTIGYVEAHGTATPLGDPIEVEALTQAFKSKERGFCAIGSVKSNFGHLVEAAGVAGLIKAVLSIRNREIPPTLHYAKPNPHIDFFRPSFVNNELRPFPAMMAGGGCSSSASAVPTRIPLEEARRGRRRAPHPYAICYLPRPRGVSTRPGSTSRACESA
jgi:hypothetical protein